MERPRELPEKPFRDEAKRLQIKDIGAEKVATGSAARLGAAVSLV